MPVRPIRILGDPVLHSPASPVGEVTGEVRAIVADLFETMAAAPGVGLAAPQIGVGLRMFVYSYADDDGEPWRGAVIDPQLWMRPTEPGEPDEDTESEGCLSFPGERFPLRRSDEVIVTGTDLDGQPVRLQVSGWRARILQHEFDHLNGVLYVDRLDDGSWKTAQKIARKRGWGRPGHEWMPGVDDLEP